jgi:hypothetical protein
VDTWSSPTTVYAGGLAQLRTAVGGRRIVLVADQRLARQIDAVRARAEGIAMLVSPALRPAAAVHDPELTSSLPRRLLAAGLVEP